MRETAPATAPTADATNDELVLATDLYARCREVDPALAIAEITASLAAARLAGFAAGYAERADEAHEAGYAEGRTDERTARDIEALDAYADGLGNR
jgi:flagellar biosynthesis/type III secretory pathway protein FliH